MFEIGRLCLKIAGRDSNKLCVVVSELDYPYVLIDGETRRKKCNIKHLEPTSKKFDINKDASHDEIKVVFKEKLGIELKDTKPKQAKPRQKKQHKKKQKPVKEKKTVKKTKTVKKKTEQKQTQESSFQEKEIKTKE